MNPKISYIHRALEEVIKKHLNRGKVIIIYGARQVGKTTLLRHLFQKEKNLLFLSCEETRIKEQLKPDKLILEKIIDQYQTVIFDEAQHLENPGLILKVAIDNFPKKNIIASGSSSFDLAEKISEPLTGRHFKFTLYPLSLSEIKKSFPPTDQQFYLEEALIFGTCPEIFKLKSREEKIEYLQLLTDAYLYKDILTFNLIKNSRKIRELLIALALQLGSEVSYFELSNTLAIDKKTVENYLDLLEKSFVVFRLYGFSRNLRSEINRKVKVYFYDLGVRNALINNFNPLNLRADEGGIFENYVIAERIKEESLKPQKTNFYFWRTYDQKEIDLIGEKEGKITAFEIKIKPSLKTNKAFHFFKKIYPQSVLKVVSKESLE